MRVLFDVEGVLVAPWRFRDLLETNYGIGPETTRKFFQTRFLSCLAGEANLKDELTPFIEEWGWPHSLDEFVRVWLEIENAPNAAVFEFAAGLRAEGWPCHVASNQERHRARYLADVMGFDQHFDSLFFSCDIGTCKPDPAYYQHIESELGCVGSALVFVDDSDRNVIAAQERGWNAIRFDGIQSLKEVAAALER